MKAFFIIAIVSVCLLAAGGAYADSNQPRAEKAGRNVTSEADYVTFALSDFTDEAADCQGRLVRVTAEVISVDFSRQLIRLYDPAAHRMLEVSTAALPRATRRALLNDPVMRAEVFGRAVMRNGRLGIDAHKIVALIAEPLAQNVVVE